MTAENPSPPSPRPSRMRRFNEAAADDRGKPHKLPRTTSPALTASMRPRPMTAENLRSAVLSTRWRSLLQ